RLAGDWDGEWIDPPVGPAPGARPAADVGTGLGAAAARGGRPGRPPSADGGSGGKAGALIRPQQTKAAGAVLTASQAPHRSGTAPAPGLRAEKGRRHSSADHPAKETTMWFRSEPTSPKSRQPAGRLRVEALEDRCVPSAYLETDAPGDFLPGYAGPHDPG